MNYILIFLLGSFASATPLIVESVDGRKATIYIPPNVTIKAGDTLQKGTQDKIQPVIDSEAPLLHGRTHRIEARYSNSSSDAKTASSSSSSEKSEILLQYGYTFPNAPFLELGLGYGFAKTKLPSSESREDFFASYLRINFINNVPVKELVPYFLVGSGISTNVIKSGTSVVNGTGSLTTLGMGFDYFPYKEILSISFSYTKVNHNIDLTNLGTKTNVKIESSGPSIGFGLHF